jgi:nucleotide-binding universal stress UspA family protein
MTIVVGANPFGDAHGAIELGVTLARTLPEATQSQTLVVASVLPSSRVDSRTRTWAHAQADEAEARARAALGGRADGLTVQFVRLHDRSAARALATLAEVRGATALVLGSAPDGPAGQVVVGSTADHLLHSSPVPLAIAPTAYRGAATTPGVAARRLTCAYNGSDLAAAAVQWAARLTREIDVQLRICSFGVRPATMYPPEIGTDIESEITAQWRDQMVEAQHALQARLGNELAGDAELVVTTADSWSAALSSVDWLPDELLVLGSSSAGALRRVFLGTNATKIIRHSPVPVLVVPHD